MHAARNKMKKSNMPCLMYRKLGRCRGKELGTCVRIHNPNQISLCTKYLQGACHNDQCLLSHKVSAEKVPTCKFYLEGMCNKDKCQYLHVKISPKADICIDFLEGYCKMAEECNKRHQFLCPDFERSGRCPYKKCQYPHRQEEMVRESKFSTRVAKRLTEQETNSVPKVETNTVPKVDTCLEEGIDKTVRYYVDKNVEEITCKNNERHGDDKDQNVPCNVDNGTVNSNEETTAHTSGQSNLISFRKCTSEESGSFISKRVILGKLPSFIPLLEKVSNN